MSDRQDNFKHEFIGYWGYGNLSELEKLLTQALNKANSKHHLKRYSYQHNQSVCGLLWSGDQQSEIYLSASGIPNLPDAVVKLEGDRLILSREPFGRVPLYWTQQNQIIWFASRLQLLLSIIASPQVSIPAFYGYNCFSYIPTPLTPIENIFSIPAGCELVWEKSKHVIIQNRYEWREAANLITDEKEAVYQLQTLLKDAIQRQLTHISSEPVGVFLSGGLDSSVVAALLVEAGVKVKAYTLDFGKYGVAELPYAEKVAAHLKIPLAKVDASPKRIKAAITATAQALDLPFGDGVTVPIYLLCQAASQETKVVFNGEGGDQLFAGWTNKPLIAAGIYNTANPNGTENFYQQYLRTFHRLYSYEAKVFPAEIYNQIHNINPKTWIAEALNPEFTHSILARLRRASLMLKGAQNIQPRATNLAFAHDLFVRSPFCDLALAEWNFQLSGELCLRGVTEKYILKRAVESWLPSEVVWREKRGMGVPLTEWCLNELWHDVIKWLNPGIINAEGRYQSQLILHIIKGQFSGKFRQRRIGEILWLMLMWEVWRVTVLEEKAEGKKFDEQLWLFRLLRKFSK